MRDYLSCPDTAKLLRQCLKEAFPGQKFSVRCDQYSMGAHIDVRWENGPTKKMVETVTRRFHGSYFDGMIDYKGSIYHTLDGKPVRLGSDGVDLHRECCDALIEWAIEMLWDEYNPRGKKPTVEEYREGLLWKVFVVENHRNEMHWSAESAIHRKKDEINWYGEIQKAPTLDRLQITGDDGYSQLCGEGQRYGIPTSTG